MRRHLISLLIGVAIGAGGMKLFEVVRSRSSAPAANGGFGAASSPSAAAGRFGATSPASPAARPAAPSAPPPRAARRIPSTPAPPASAAPAPAPAPTAGTLHIDADVPGAQVFIDRNFLGVTPMTAENITPGPHQLNVSAPGYDGVSEPIEVAVGSRGILIKFKEVRLKASLDVVHRHRFGSCKGQLIATPQGVRYETTNKDDAFSATLLDIDKFEVDYLAKNLRLEIKKGRRYDFTDPQGNADLLFVFHRDVDKARVRLQNGEKPAVD